MSCFLYQWNCQQSHQIARKNQWVNFSKCSSNFSSQVVKPDLKSLILFKCFERRRKKLFYCSTQDWSTDYRRQTTAGDKKDFLQCTSPHPDAIFERKKITWIFFHIKLEAGSVFMAKLPEKRWLYLLHAFVNEQAFSRNLPSKNFWKGFVTRLWSPIFYVGPIPGGNWAFSFIVEIEWQILPPPFLFSIIYSL